MCLSSIGIHGTPYTYLAALLATATLLCYGLDGEDQGHTHIPGLPRPPTALPPHTDPTQEHPHTHDSPQPMDIDTDTPVGARTRGLSQLGGVDSQGGQRGEGHVDGSGDDNSPGHADVGAAGLAVGRRLGEENGGASDGTGGVGQGDGVSAEDTVLEALRAAAQRRGLSAQDRAALLRGVQLQELHYSRHRAAAANCHWQGWVEARLKEFERLQPWPESRSEVRTAQLHMVLGLCMAGQAHTMVVIQERAL